MTGKQKTLLVLGSTVVAIGTTVIIVHTIKSKAAYKDVMKAIGNITNSPADKGQLKPSSPRSLVLTDNSATEIAKELHDSIHYFTVNPFAGGDMVKLNDAMNKIASQVEFSQVVNKYSALYGIDLVSDMGGELNDTNNKTFTQLKNDLPKETFING